MREFPPERYSQPQGAHPVTPEISVSEWRDSVLRILMDKGTAEACRQIERVVSALPQYSWLKEFTLIEARRIALQKSWQPPAVDQVLKLVENHELRLVNSPDELMDIVLDSLEELEVRLQKGEQPQAIDLWNERRVTEKKEGKPNIAFVCSPKDEGRLSDKIKIHLQEDLLRRGVVINREVEIKRGSETDIHISAFTRDEYGRPKDLMKVTIEVKGCWNREMETAMGSQLIGKYLNGTDCTKGIYLIGWFMCDRWNDEYDSRFKMVPKIDINAARGKYSIEAKKLSAENAVRVEAVVIDCRL
jgi:hypothetical protein